MDTTHVTVFVAIVLALEQKTHQQISDWLGCPSNQKNSTVGVNTAMDIFELLRKSVTCNSEDWNQA